MLSAHGRFFFTLSIFLWVAVLVAEGPLNSIGDIYFYRNQQQNLTKHEKRDVLWEQTVFQHHSFVKTLEAN